MVSLILEPVEYIWLAPWGKKAVLLVASHQYMYVFL